MAEQKVSDTKVDPIKILEASAKEHNVKSIYDEAFATAMDAADPLKGFRSKFHIPKAEPHTSECEEALYL